MKVYGVCRITKDPELKVTQSGVKVVKFTIASNRDFKNTNGEYEADFINCVAWRNQAEFISNYVKKGNQLFLEGSWRTGKYDTSDGRTVYTNELYVDNVKLLEKRENAPQQAEMNNTAHEQAFGNDEFQIDDSDLPF